MENHQRIVLLVYDGFELLDLSGPSSVFNAANSVGGEPYYEILTVSTDGGLVTASCGIAVATKAIDRTLFKTCAATVLVVGSEGNHLIAAMRDQALLDFLKTAASNAERCGSVCSGAFLLAAAGLLDGKNAATHWAGCQHLKRWFPNVIVDEEALYVVDGPIWTSAGVTTGIDMALAMVGGDHGAHLKGKVARHLVVYSHRPGFQTQFSTILDAQIAGTDPFSDVLEWIDQNLHQSVRVAQLAMLAGMTERSFYRRFTETMGVSPARYLCLARLERARQLLAAGQPVKRVYAQVGFASEAAFRKAFKSHLGTTPALYGATQSPA